MSTQIKRILMLLVWIGAIAGGILALGAILAQEHKKVK